MACWPTSYGPQKLLAEKLVPPMLVHANRHFLRGLPRHRRHPPPTRPLAQYAVDLVRQGDGRWYVLADHTEVPAGIGYALEIRRVLARSLPEAFRSIPVRHLRPFIDRWHDSLAAMAPTDVANPNMAVLTPGSLSPRPISSMSTSRARSGYRWSKAAIWSPATGEVSIKTLAGLRPVHMLLRRLDSSFADPLELRADSALGVTGLVETTRLGKIALANALGSGLAETPALMPFLEQLSQHMLNQKLELPSLDVWWLGEPTAYAFAMAQLGSMIVRPVSRPGPRADHCRHARSGGTQGAGAAHRQPARPVRRAVSCRALAQPQVGRQGRGLEPATMVLRCFVVSDGYGYRVLPGGPGARARG